MEKFSIAAFFKKLLGGQPETLSMAKLEVFPSFLKPCTFQLERKTSSSKFTFKTDHINKTAGAKNNWEIDFNPSEGTEKIEQLAKTVVYEAKRDDRLILDGVSLKCTYIENGITKQYEFRCPESKTNEFLLVQEFFLLAENNIRDAAFVNYIELLAQYFFNRPKIRIFDETPLRIRLFASLTVNDKEALTNAINKILDKDEVVIDMSNFGNMGTVLYECFTPLSAIPKLKFIANKNATRHIEEMGFEKKLVTVV